MITVITTFYQGNAYMPKLIQMLEANAKRLLAEVGKRVEYLLINDSPWDPIRLPETGVEDLTIRILDNAENQGIHKSRIRGIREAKGELLTILDQDDEIAEDFLVSQYRALGSRDVVICNGYKELPEHTKSIYKDRLKMSLINRMKIYLKAANQIVSPGQALLRKSAIPQAWLDYPMASNGADDLYLWLLYLTRGTKFVINPQKLYTHKQVGDNLSNSLEAMCRSDEEMCGILREHSLLPEKAIRKRERMCAFLAENGYRNRPTLKAILKYPDILFWKAFAYFC
ncbi:MAG: glycosyltransferase [Oscillospiraceae bacterium]|nr:glycosyltransferase [Oscillospiraceae bacterium]